MVLEVITTGKNTVINSRPTKAGLNILRPSPPHKILPKITAIAEPKATTYQGVKGANVKANKTAVTIAEPSSNVLQFLRKTPANINSAIIALTTAMNIINNEASPYAKYEMTAQGTRANRTSDMTSQTLSLVRIKGVYIILGSVGISQ